MIYTLTLNPSIDYIMQIKQINLGGTNYANNEYMLPGGKGINVSRVLNQLDVPNKALGFIAGHTGKFIEDWLEKEEASYKFISVKGQTRINVKLKGKNETEINGNGPIITQENIQKLKQQINRLTKKDTLILSGSKSKGLPGNFYHELIEICQKNQVSFVIDTNSKELLQVLSMQPFLVKPNQTELGDLFNQEIHTKEEAIKYGKKLQKAGAQNVIVSLGGDGAIFIDEKQVFIGQSPKGKVLNTVGAGDSMIAGFMAGIEKGQSKEEAFKLAIQSGSATAFNEDLAKKEDIRTLDHQIEIERFE